jgi:hypothetical protein
VSARRHLLQSLGAAGCPPSGNGDGRQSPQRTSAKGPKTWTHSLARPCDPTRFSSYRGQLTLATITLGIFLVGLVMTIVAGLWPIAAAFVADWIAKC